MIEFATPAAPDRPDLRNVADLLATRAAAAPAHVAFQVRDGAAWRDVTTREFEDTVIAVAKGMVATGVEPGDAVAVIAATRYEWAVVDFASAYAGAVVVPLYPTSSESQAAAILADSRPVLAFAGEAVHADLLRVACAAAGIPALPIWSMDPAPGADLPALAARGADLPDSTSPSVARSPRPTTSPRSSTRPVPPARPRASSSPTGTWCASPSRCCTPTPRWSTSGRTR